MTIGWMILLLAGSPQPDAFPAVPGWKAEGRVMEFDSAGLFKAINGAAELYLSYGFQQLRVRDFVRGKSRVAVSVYDMGAPLDAFGIYRRERPPGAKILSGGAEAVASPPAQCLLLKDRYYVKFEAMRGKLGEKECQGLVEPVARALPGKDGYPVELDLLPDADQVQGSIGYTREGYLGISDLRNSLHARYRMEGGTEAEVFVLLPPDGQTSEDLFEALATRWSGTRHGNLTALTRTIPYRGTVAVLKTEKGLLGLSGLPTTEAALGALEKMTTNQ